MALAAVPFGLVIGLAVGMLGGGGSVLAVPVLVYVLGQSVAEATTASLVVVTAGALAGGLAHHREGRVCWRHAAVFTAAAVPGILAGTAAGNAVSPGLLIAAFALVMLVAAAGTWRRATRGEAAERSTGRTACPALKLLPAAVAGIAVGFMTGFFGVGGGFLIVPALAMALAFSMRLAVGTSLVIVAATSVMGVAVHLAAGRSLDLGVTAAMSAACVAGAIGGAALSGRIPQHRLERGFAVLVAAVAAYLLVSATVLGGPPGSS